MKSGKSAKCTRTGCDAGGGKTDKCGEEEGGGVVHKKANLRTRKKRCSGEASARRLRMISGKSCAERWRRRILEKYRVEEAKKSARRGRGEPREWRIVMKEKKYLQDLADG